MIPGLVLGINTTYHETAACIIYKGQILGAVEEERLSRVKHGKKALFSNPHIIPYRAITWCLEQAGRVLGQQVKITDVEALCISFHPEKRLRTQIIQYPFPHDEKERMWWEFMEWTFYRLHQWIPYVFTYGRESPVPHMYQERMGLPTDVKEIQNRLVWIPHHLAHAASAFYPSPFDQAMVLSIDGIGESVTTWLGYGQGNRLIPLRTIEYPHSWGFVFERVTEFFGLERNHDESKIMALAAFGQPDTYIHTVREWIKLLPNGTFSIDNNIFRFRKPFHSIGWNNIIAPSCQPQEAYEVLSKNRQYQDFAAAIQRRLEETLNHIVQWLYEQIHMKYLCLSGGVALNCVAVGKLLSHTSVEKIYVQPAAHDAGTALGAALYYWHHKKSQTQRYQLSHAFLGPSYSSTHIQGILQHWRMPYLKFDNDEKLLQTAARALFKGYVIGWYEGALEWGPRALGHRSILAHPGRNDVKNKLYSAKKRPIFSPFAPSVLENRMHEWFQTHHPSPFMNIALPAKNSQIDKISSVVHVDGTSRIHTVHSSIQPRFSKLLEMFEHISGIPMLLNTSWNQSGEPIVCTPEEAIIAGQAMGLDALVLESFWIPLQKEDAEL